MSEAVTFWMENKSCVGKTVATFEDQTLVSYRDRYYVLIGGVAQSRSGKSVRYTLSSLPPHWKRALKGEGQLPVAAATAVAAVPGATSIKRERKKTEKPAMSEQKMESAPEKSDPVPGPALKPSKKSEAKATPPSAVMANCPYCAARHDIAVDKGKLSRPFFIVCSKCSNEFAVRLVPVTSYQAQVAGFR